MRLVGLRFPLNSFAPQLCFRLGGSEKVGGEFLMAHVVKDFLRLFQTFLCMNLALSESTVQPLVAVVLEDGVVHRVDNARVVRGVDQSLVVLGNLSA